jgi:predicted nucleotidyltransferase
MERSVSGYLDARRENTKKRLGELHGKLAEAQKIARDRACVYVTGSFGRQEASSHSDLDVFIVGRPANPASGQEQQRRALSRLDEICLKAELIAATRAMGFPTFSGDGEYLTHHTVDDLVKTLGHPNDDASNTFTARLLLLLESKPLLTDEIYQEAIDGVIAEYWGDFPGHESTFIPAFLANDILRLWRTFCVNYEARTEREPDEKKAKRKLKNYKLKHSRLLTCYSALAYLLAVFAARKTVTPGDARTMVDLTPTARLQTIVRDHGADAKIVADLLGAYERFLQNTDAPESDLVNRFMDPGTSRRYITEANDFGDLVSSLLDGMGKGTRLHRLLLV